MAAVQYRPKNIIQNITLRLKNTLPDTFWFLTFLFGLAKVLAFLGLTTSWSNNVFAFFSPIFNVTSYIAISFTFGYFSLALIFKGRSRLWAVFILNTVLTSLLIFDLMYFRGYGDFISVHLIKQASNLDNLGSSVFSMLRMYDILFILDLVISFILLVRYKTYGKNISRRIPLFVLLLALTSGYISYAHYQYDIVENGQNRIVFRICWTPTDTMRNLSPIGYHIYDSYVYFKENRVIELTEEEKDNIKRWYEQNQEETKNNSFKGLFAGQNLILLQVESLENFVLNQSYGNQEITPNLNRLLKNSIYFPNFYEQVWNGTTSDAELLANTSVFPVRRGSTFFRFPLNQYNSMPVLLEGKGYTTQAIHPDKGSYWNWKQALTSFGFDNTIDASAFNQDEQIGLGLSDGSFLRQVVPILKETKQPFYNFMITLSSHGPFDIPKDYRELALDPTLDQSKLGGYFQSLHYTDKHIGLFLQNLDQAGLLDNTVIVIYGDHGGIHKYYNDELAGIQPQEEWWMNYDKKVPFIIYKKGMSPKVVETTGGQIDILPTIAYLMGVNEDKYSHTTLGRNLLNTEKDYAILADGTLMGKSSDIKEHAMKGIDISDLLIQSNYFQKQTSQP
jgi:lipoteichoic acid synthase